MSGAAPKHTRLEFLQEPRAKRLPLRLLSPAEKVGLVEWFRPGAYEQVEQTLADLKLLGVTRLRTCLSWADWHTGAGQEWYRWLWPHLAKQVEVLPCLVYTPPSLGLAPKTSSPPRVPKDYADFVDHMLTQFGKHFSHLELWNEPNNASEWDWTLDRQWLLFCETIGAAAYWAHRRGWRTVLGGIAPVDPNWLRLMFARGVMQHIDVVGFHGFPDTFEYAWESWEKNLQRLQQELERHRAPMEIWITEAGVSTWRHNEYQQLQALVEVLGVPVPRVYWYALRDLDPALPTVDGFHTDEREYHFGLRRHTGAPKLLFRLWQGGGLEAVQQAVRLGRAPRRARRARPVAITGGAGFIGTNLADRLASEGQSVLLLDNLSRPGVEENLRWLHDTHGDRVQVEVVDLRDRFALTSLEGVSRVFHFAAQVAVTTSVTDPVEDCDVNVRGTLNLLEALRALPTPPPLLYTSTNKVYGNLPEVALEAQGARYQPLDPEVAARGISEAQPLDFHSPYGCSKGAAEQYVLDYGRTYGLPTVVFRMSCIYGPHQCGCEDQGWVAHFLMRARQGEPITLYGDGKQVRDVLYVSDLLEAMLLAQEHLETLAGQAFNIGGGPENALSLQELLRLIGELQGRAPKTRPAPWRPGDQRYYVSDTRRFAQATGWAPQVSAREGVGRLYQWLGEAAAPRAAARPRVKVA